MVLSGIRAEIAQTMVNLGLDLADITTFSSLHQAVNTLIKRINTTQKPLIWLHTHGLLLVEENLKFI